MSDNYQRDLEKQNEALREQVGVSARVALEQSSELRTLRAKVEVLGRDLLEARDQARAATKERDLTQQNYTEAINALHECRQDCAGERAAFQRAMDEAISLKNERDELKARAEKAEADCAAKDSAFAAYVARNSVEHEDDGCPEDDTCECPLVVALNAAFNTERAAGSALLDRLRAAEGTWNDHVDRICAQVAKWADSARSGDRDEEAAEHLDSIHDSIMSLKVKP